MNQQLSFLLSFAAAVFLIVPHAATGQTQFYFCEVRYIGEAKNGRLHETTTGGFGVKSNGERFSINTRTGEMVGQVFRSQHWAQTHVIDNGSSPRGSALKVLYTSPLGAEFVNSAFLQVHPRDDQQPSQQTFILVEGQFFYSGVCRGD